MIPHKIFILVGGLGTRLRSVVSELPKPMAPVEGKPFLWYKLQQLKHVGFRNFVFCSGYMSSIIKDFFGDGNKWDVSIEYSHEEKPLGTAGALLNAKSLINAPFFMCNGDTYLNFEPKPMLDFAELKKAKHCMLLTDPHEQGQEGLVKLNRDNKILDFIEKPKQNIDLPVINAGIYYLSPDILKHIPKNKKCSLEREVFPNIVGEEKSFYGYKYEGYFIDIGIPKNYKQFCKDVKKGNLQKSSKKNAK